MCMALLFRVSLSIRTRQCRKQFNKTKKKNIWMNFKSNIRHFINKKCYPCLKGKMSFLTKFMGIKVKEKVQQRVHTNRITKIKVNNSRKIIVSQLILQTNQANMADNITLNIQSSSVKYRICCKIQPLKVVLCRTTYKENKSYQVFRLRRSL